jgi:prepilin-type N-terminal cleavage/methylation domain-containing protein
MRTQAHGSFPRRGFTLIELLITVGIIAILAAIAIPNLLEAQVRSKVSRAKAEIKTVVTALEAYHVDHGTYPSYHYSAVPSAALEFHIGGEVPDFAVPDPNFDGRNPVTTPVAYITQFPQDPFTTHKRGEPQEVRQYLYVNWDHAIERVAEPRKSVFGIMKERYGAYRLHSRGPDTRGPESGTPYDPTNGTVSTGDITYGPNLGYDRFVPAPSGA